MRAGDLIGTGTISGPHDSMYGCLLEKTWRGTRDIVIHSSMSSSDSGNIHREEGPSDKLTDDMDDCTDTENGTKNSRANANALPLSVTRRYLEDGDVVTMKGFAQGHGYRVGFGEVLGRVVSAIKDPY